MCTYMYTRKCHQVTLGVIPHGKVTKVTRWTLPTRIPPRPPWPSTHPSSLIVRLYFLPLPQGDWVSFAYYVCRSQAIICRAWSDKASRKRPGGGRRTCPPPPQRQKPYNQHIYHYSTAKGKRGSRYPCQGTEDFHKSLAPAAPSRRSQAPPANAFHQLCVCPPPTCTTWLQKPQPTQDVSWREGKMESVKSGNKRQCENAGTSVAVPTCSVRSPGHVMISCAATALTAPSECSAEVELRHSRKNKASSLCRRRFQLATKTTTPSLHSRSAPPSAITAKDAAVKNIRKNHASPRRHIGERK